MGEREGRSESADLEYATMKGGASTVGGCKPKAFLKGKEGGNVCFGESMGGGGGVFGEKRGFKWQVP